jgi:hypothetical protein
MKMNKSDGELRENKAKDDLKRVRPHLTVLEPQASEAPPSTQQALSRFKSRYILKENTSMFEKVFNRKFRFAWVAVGVIAILAAAMLFPQVRAIGSSFLGLFRVEQFTILQFDAEVLEERLSSASN